MKIDSDVSFDNGNLFKDITELWLGDMKEVVTRYGEGGNNNTYIVATRVTMPVKPNIPHLYSTKRLTNFPRSISSVW